MTEVRKNSTETTTFSKLSARKMSKLKISAKANTPKRRFRSQKICDAEIEVSAEAEFNRDRKNFAVTHDTWTDVVRIRSKFFSKDRNIYCLTTSALDKVQILLATGPLVPQKKRKKKEKNPCPPPLSFKADEEACTVHKERKIDYEHCVSHKIITERGRSIL